MVKASVGMDDHPYEAMRVHVCEKMSWTFSEFDATRAEDIFTMLEVWRIQDLSKGGSG